MHFIAKYCKTRLKYMYTTTKLHSTTAFVQFRKEEKSILFTYDVQPISVRYFDFTQATAENPISRRCDVGSGNIICIALLNNPGNFS